MPLKTTRQKLLTVLLAPVLFLGLLEIGLRLAGFSYDPVAEGTARVPHGEWEDIEHYRPDPELLWTLKQNDRLDDIRIGFVDVRSNSAGLRGPELPGPKAADELRILCLGDSILFGLGLTEEQSVPVQLQRCLDAGPLARRQEVSVISAAVPGWSSLQGRRMLDRLSFLEPDLVVFWFGMNDAQPAKVLPDEQLGAPNRTLQGVTTVLASLRSFQLVQRLLHSGMSGADDPRRVSPERFGEIVRDLTGRAGAGGPEVLFVRCPETLDLAIAQTRQVIARATEEGVDRVFGPFPLLAALMAAPPDTDLVGVVREVEGETVLVLGGERVDFSADLDTLIEDLDYLEKIRAALRANLASLPADSVDPATVFGATPRNEFFIDACHLSPLGAKLAANSLARIIEERLGR